MPELTEDSAGTLALGDLRVRRLGFGSMRLTGEGVWGAPDDPEVPFEDSLGALIELREEGKICHLGISNVTVDELDRAQAMTEIVSVQNRFNLQDRRSEDVLDACARRGIAFIPWFPLAVGPLARPVGPLDQIAERHDATPSQIALAWLLNRSPAMLPIPGTSSIDHLEENVGAAQISLTDGDMAELNAAAN